MAVSMKLLVALSAILVAVQAAEPLLGYRRPNFELGFGRIVNGVEAQRAEFPHQVSLQWGYSPVTPFQHFCGGSIIASDWIVTAAHCTIGLPSYGSIVVKAGKHDLQKFEDTEQQSKVLKTIVHAKYGNNVGPYDIALWKLKTPLTFNEAVKPISLPAARVKPNGYSVLSGWGSVSRNGQTAAKKLQKADLPLLDLYSCEKKFRDAVGVNAPLHESNICSETTSDGGVACSGDSGGPLIQHHATDSSQLIGIVSWGMIPCGIQNAPAVYVDVAYFVDWIKDNIARN